MRDIKIGIIGCGQVSRVGHGPAIKKDKRARVVAVADPDEENRIHFTKKFHVPHSYSDHRDMLEKEDLDAVVIASPPWLHCAQFQDCIQSGLHILCEKPLATTLEDCKKMASLAERHDRIVQACHSKRFETGFERIKKLLESGSLGQIYQTSVYWHYYIPDFTKGRLRRIFDFLKKHGMDLEKKYGTWRYFDERAGGGDFFDHGPHYIDLLRFFFGEIESVYCTTRRFYESHKFEDLAVAVFSLTNDSVAVMEKSIMVMGRPSGFEKGHIYGEHAKLEFEAFQEYQHRPMKLKLYKKFNILPDISTPLFLPRGKKQTLYFRQMRHFIDRVNNKTAGRDEEGEQWAAGIEDAMMAVAWTLAAYRSAAEGREIRRGELFIKQ
ncbi:MAG: Gfo/Idh/MocA family oxidoreductase [Spirochaetes bacterium]|nr:Gfo/Idh/MocA family oxidoreductase [Spirochaetota bacterium]